MKAYFETLIYEQIFVHAKDFMKKMVIYFFS